MGVFRTFLSVLVVLLAIALAGVPGKLGLWRFLDSYVGPRGNMMFKGVAPVFHQHEPWGFNHTTLGVDALKGRTFVVTGANVGLGLGTVHYLAQHGGKVILACRSMKNCEEAVKIVQKDVPTAALVPLVLDLSSFKSIKSFATAVQEKTNEIHSLILNAGIMHTPYGLTEDGIEQQIGVNHFGHAYLVRLLEDVLKKIATKELPATIVVVSSMAHYSTYPEGVRTTLEEINNPDTYQAGNAYGQSKLANVLFAQQLAERLKPYNILVNSVHPGFVDTELMRGVTDTLTKNFPTVVDIFTRIGFPKVFRAIIASIAWDPKDAALTQVYAAVSPEVLSKHITGKYYHPIAREALSDRIHGVNTTLQQKFWEFTEKVLDEKAPK